MIIENAESLSIKELEQKIEELQRECDIFNAEQMSIKILINSMYGVFANRYFYFFNPDIAKTITLQGQNITKSTIAFIDHYFFNIWPNDKKLHEKLGLSKVKPISKSPCKYGDTDSVFISFEEIYNNIEGYHKEDSKYPGVDFILDIFKYRLNKYFEKCFESYAKKFNATPLLNLELEKIAHSMLCIHKKKYVLDMAWKETGVRYNELEKIVATGGEISQSSTPAYAKKQMMELLKYILSNRFSFNILDFLVKLNEIKSSYMLQDLDNISISVKVNNYEKFIINDQETIELKSGCPYNVRAASYYNHLLNHSYPNMKTKYPLIRSGDKIKLYIAKTENPEFKYFAYSPNDYPYEFAPSIDWDAHFEKYIVYPVNAFMKAIGQNKINSNLFIKTTLF